MTNTLATFWTGSPLSTIEYISALSFREVGHQLIIYAVGDIGKAPPGVEVRDAREILDTNIVKHRKSGSVAIYADFFRYALFTKTDFTWVDLDIVAIKPIDISKPYVFGYENDREVNNAVLKLPKTSPALAELLKFGSDTHGYPPTLKGFRRLKYMVKSFGLGMHISEWPWGSTGPRALTHFAELSGEITHAQNVDAFYPISHHDAHRFAEPNQLNFESFPEETQSVHLWGKALRATLRDKHGGRIPENSFLDIARKRYSRWSGYSIP